MTHLARRKREKRSGKDVMAINQSYDRGSSRQYCQIKQEAPLLAVDWKVNTFPETSGCWYKFLLDLNVGPLLLSRGPNQLAWPPLLRDDTPRVRSLSSIIKSYWCVFIALYIYRPEINSVYGLLLITARHLASLTPGTANKKKNVTKRALRPIWTLRFTTPIIDAWSCRVPRRSREVGHAWLVTRFVCGKYHAVRSK